MLTVVDGKLLNTRDVANTVASLLMNGMPIDEIAQIEGMPSAVQIAYLRKYDAQFQEALKMAFEGAGIESAFTLMAGARTGKIGKNQLEAAKWVAERMAPDLFQERKTVTNEIVTLTDEELAFQLQAAARSDERVRRLLQDADVDILGPGDEAKPAEAATTEAIPDGPTIDESGAVVTPDPAKTERRLAKAREAAKEQRAKKALKLLRRFVAKRR